MFVAHVFLFCIVVRESCPLISLITMMFSQQARHRSLLMKGKKGSRERGCTVPLRNHYHGCNLSQNKSVFCNVNVNFQPKKIIISNCGELDKSLNIAVMIKGSIHGCDYIYGRKEFKKKCFYIFLVNASPKI